MIGKLMGLLLVVGLMTGCSSSSTVQYEVMVKNQTKENLSVGIVKMRGSMEPAHATPAQILLEAPEYAGRAWGTLVKPGEATTLGPAELSLEPGSYVVLRAYMGNKIISELVAVGSMDPDTYNVMLPMGQSGFVLLMKNGQLTGVMGDGKAP